MTALRTKEHFIRMFSEGNSIVNAQLMARAVYAARHGFIHEVDRDDLRPIMDEIGLRDFSSEEALTLLEEQKHWQEALEDDPIPPWALQAVLDHLVLEDAIPSGRGRRGQTWLARQLDVDPSTVRRWISGTSGLSGMRAQLVRITLSEHL